MQNDKNIIDILNESDKLLEICNTINNIEASPEYIVAACMIISANFSYEYSLNPKITISMFKKLYKIYEEENVNLKEED